MAEIFLVLFLISLVCLIIGAIKPALVIRWGGRTRKQALTLYGVLTLIFFIGVGVNSEPPENNGQEQRQQPVVTESTNEQVAQKPANWPEVEITPDTVKTALSDAKGGLTVMMNDKNALREIQVVDHAGTPEADDKLIHIRINVGDNGEKTAARRVAESITAYSEILYKHPKISEVTVWGYATFVDQFGKESDQTAVRISWTKGTAEKVEYENFKRLLTGDYTRAFNIADSYYFHPSVFANLPDKKDLKAQK